ncbi:5'-nucleotidase, lipoprotein e(P4) family [Priestia megaterium]|uniref:5'-nucleotidase, lipoprotein e(P4) family n=1 Tax=Priestia megaterium TaxID=1404 RepID=UPI002282873D|nr:5'-nucleotidase, lipoprotein e(P4) family [Priestia megaterium]MCY9023596.1 5'-nucleotidase, lipoprotein e(P4) family [Priestia megaterium]
MNKKLSALTGVAVLAFSLTACAPQHEKEVSAEKKEPAQHLADQQIMADAWYQTSGEMKALYYQGYNTGKLRLDETVLDNSPFQASAIKTGKGFPYKWDEWVQAEKAKAVPGAVDFLTYADQKGVDIYYISGRTTSQLEATIKNLKNLHIPQATKDHVLLTGPKDEGKETRRQKVATNHNVVLLFGDNLSDFSGFDKKSITDRNKLVEEQKETFGQKLIVFPNPMYGDWEGAIYNYDYSISDKQKDKLRREQLQYFN